jgi:hypothetical protein
VERHPTHRQGALITYEADAGAHGPSHRSGSLVRSWRDCA